MKYANQISEIINAFSPEPIKCEYMEEFYCAETMEFRMSDKYSSPIEDIYDICCEGNQVSLLLLGHKGCGKSTELNRLSLKLLNEGHPVRTIVCSTDLDLFNIVYSDLLILMGEALLDIARDYECEIDKEILSDFSNFWSECVTITTCTDITEGAIETGVNAATPAILSGLLKVFANVKANLRFNEENRTEYRKKISGRSSEWIELLSLIAKQIREKRSGKAPIIIFEDLDKLNPEDAWNIFYNYAAILSGMSFPVIYTFPIGLSYDTRFAALESYFIAKTLPMIKIETLEGTTFAEGINVIKKIVEKRSNLSLYEDNVLDTLIRNTGGSLRDLFFTINSAAKRAGRREADKISMEDAQRASEELQTSLTRRIEEPDYEFLKSIYIGDKELIRDKEMLLKMLQASVVLEYNGKRWHNIHPLVAKFLKERGLVDNVET